jgi:hypothetical protein
MLLKIIAKLNNYLNIIFIILLKDNLKLKKVKACSKLG